MRKTIILSGILAAALAGVLAFVLLPGPAEEPSQPVNLRFAGMIADVSGEDFTVTSEDGTAVSVHLGPETRVVSNAPLSLEDIQPGDHFAVDLEQTATGSWWATTGHTQSEPFRDDALRFRPIEDQPEAMRLLGVVETIDTGPIGAAVTARYDQGELAFYVPKNITLYRVLFDGPSLLKPEMAVNVVYNEAPDGTITGRFITVEKDGVKPIAE